MSLPYFPSLPPSQFDADIAYLEERLVDNPEDRYAATCLLQILDYYTPNGGLGAFSECQREIFSRYQEDGWARELLETDKAAEHYHHWNGLLASRDLHPPIVVTQLFAGQIIRIHGEESDCPSRMSLFLQEGVISRFCNDCYKVQILPADLTGLIQTYFVFRGLELPRDNARKCMIELREDVPNPYKGYIFCESEDEAVQCREMFESALRSFGITNIHCGISHGCSEYGIQYPDFKYASDGAHRAFTRPDAWDRLEDDFFARNELHAHYKDHHNKQGITIFDVLGFRTWVKYAELIGDDACHKFLGGPVITMPEHFVARAKEQAPGRQSQMEALRQRSSSKA